MEKQQIKIIDLIKGNTRLIKNNFSLIRGIWKFNTIQIIFNIIVIILLIISWKK